MITFNKCNKTLSLATVCLIHQFLKISIFLFCFCRLYKTFIKNLTSHLKEQCEESAIPIILRNILPQKYDKYIPSIISAMKSALHYLQSYEISGCASGDQRSKIIKLCFVQTPRIKNV